MSKLFKFISKNFSLIFKGEIALALYGISNTMPNWLFRFNKADILCTENFIFPEKLNPDIQVRIADYSDIDEIIRISGVNFEHIKKMMDSGAKCFIASFKEESASAVTWSANGCTFVKGLAFFHDVGPNGYYIYGSITLPEARGRGMYFKIQKEKSNYEKNRNGNKFFATIEFTNTYSYDLHCKMGYKPSLLVTYFRLFGVSYCKVRDIEKGESNIRIVFREPMGDVIII